MTDTETVTGFFLEKPWLHLHKTKMAFMKISKILILCSIIVMVWDTTCYDPKWDLSTGRSTINYDVSGYYWYLPAIFVYGDVKEQKWMDAIFKKYRPTSDLQQAFKHKPSGNYVMKHSIGQSIMYSPFFFLSHLYASFSDEFAADGFSTPYQFGIFFGSLFIAFLGLFIIRKVLLQFFDEWTTTIALFCLIFGSNWYEYSTFSGAMTHNYLFVIYALLLWACIQFYKSPTIKKSILIGLLTGMAALTRPTEILSVLIPLLWVGDLKGQGYLSYKLEFFSKHFSKILIAGFVCFLVGSIQLIYWKYASGDWIVYSYGEQGFNFLAPYFLAFNFSWKTGWLLYSPLMYFALVGFVFFFKRNRNLFIPCFTFFILFWYVAFSWKIWSYGGCIGQRTMVQSYAVLLFPLGYFIDWIRNQKRWIHLLFGALVVFFSYYNMWLSHSGGIFKAGHMTKAYFWKTILTNTPVESDLKLLDATKEFIGERTNVKEIYFNDLENESGELYNFREPIEGNSSFVLKGSNASYPTVSVDLKEIDSEWIRVSADFRCDVNQWNWWKMPQMKIRLYKGDYVVYEEMIRLSRFLKDNEPRNLFLDINREKVKNNKVAVLISNMHNENYIWIDNLKIETFDAK